MCPTCEPGIYLARKAHGPVGLSRYGGHSGHSWHSGHSGHIPMAQTCYNRHSWHNRHTDLL